MTDCKTLYIYNRYRVLLLSILCLLVCTSANAQRRGGARQTDSRIHLIHSDVLYKTPSDPGAEILVGKVKISHEGCVLDCDSARYFRDDNSFDAYGHVKMVQGDTLKLTSDSLFYDGYGLQAHARGKVVLTHRKSRLVTEKLDYDRAYGVGMYIDGGKLYDNDNVLTSDWGQYTPSTHEAYFTDNVQLTNPKFKLVSDKLYYYTDTEVARIVSPTNVTTDDGTFVYGEAGDYDTKHDKAFLLNRSYIIKDMRKIVGDSLHYEKSTGVSEAFGNVIITDDENQCALQGDYCWYEEGTGNALATGRAVAMEYSSPDTMYVHGDTLKMFTYNLDTDSVYHNLHAYYHVRMFRNDVQAVCDSLVSLELDSCTYMYGQPILWNEQQQVFGEEIRVYNNDSTINWVHIMRQAMTIERKDSVSYNQVSSHEMKCYFKDGQLEHNEAQGNVYVVYFMDEDDGARIGMNYTETTELKLYLENKKVKKIWMPAATGTMYPALKIPPEKRYLSGFAWFDNIRPVDKDDIFEWRGKSEEQVLKKTETKAVPLQQLNKIRKKEAALPASEGTDAADTANAAVDANADSAAATTDAAATANK